MGPREPAGGNRSVRKSVHLFGILATLVDYAAVFLGEREGMSDELVCVRELELVIRRRYEGGTPCQSATTSYSDPSALTGRRALIAIFVTVEM